MSKLADAADDYKVTDSTSKVSAWISGQKAGARLPFFWGFAEASFFVIVPDVMIGLVALWSFKRGLKAAAWATLGATLGGSMVYLAPNFWQAFFHYLPGIGAPIMADAAARFAIGGWMEVVRAPQSGLPYKLFAAEAAQQGRPLIELLAWTPIARSWRFLAVAVIAGFVGLLAKPVRRTIPWLAVGLYLFVWIIIYVQYAMFLRATY